MDFRILGPLEVERDGALVGIGGGQLRALLVLLLLHANDAVSTDRLVDELWGERPPAGAHKNAQVLVSRLRKALGDGRVETRPDGYILRVADGELDVDRFQQRVEEGRGALAEGDPERARRLLGEALALWRGAPLAEVADVAFVRDEIARLGDLRLSATEDRIDAELALGSDRELVPELEQLVRSDPFRERLLGQLMLALYRSGRQAAALEWYRDARRAFAEELGIEPGLELRELERAILNQDLTWAPPQKVAPPGEPGRSPPRFALVAAAALVLATLASVLSVTLASSGGRTLSKLAPNSIGVIDPKTNKISGQVPLGSPPTKVVAGDGAVWATSNANRVLWRIDPRARRVAATIALDGAASAIAVAPDAVWVLNAHGSGGYPGPDSEISRVNPRFDQVLTTFPTGGEYTDLIEGALAYAGGALWAVDESAETTSPPFKFDLLRIDPVTRRVRRVRASAWLDLAVGEGALWTIPGVLARLDPKTLRIDTSISVAATGGPVPASVIVGDGSVWTANAYPEGANCASRPPCVSKAGTVTRIDPLPGRVTATITVGQDPVAIAVGLGAVWVANRSSESLSRIDPATNRVVATIKLGSPPAAIAVGGDAVWVAVG